MEEKKNGSGERAISMVALVGTSSQSQKCQSQQRCLSVPCLWCCSSWLILGSSWHTAHENASRLWTKVMQKNVPAFPSASFCGLRQLALSPCLTCAPVPPFSFFLAVGKPKAHFPGCYWHLHSCMPLSSLSSAKALWNSCLVSSRIYQQKQKHRRRGRAWDVAMLWETADSRCGWALRHGCAVGDSCADAVLVVSSSGSRLTSLQKHCGTVSGPKAKNAPFNRNWLHQFYLRSQSLLHKQNPKSSGNVLFLVVSFYSFSNKIRIMLQCHPVN